MAKKGSRLPALLTARLLLAAAAGCGGAGTIGTGTTGAPVSAVTEVHSPDASTAFVPLSPETRVPDAVRAAAGRYIQGQLAYWNRSTGVYATIDGRKQMVGEPAVYDTWRIDGLSFVRSFTELDGKPVQDFLQSGDAAAFDALDVYQLRYRLHTTTPDKVILAGGMNIDADGWVWFNSPYLIFSNNNGSPVFLFAMIDEVMADATIFPEDLLRRLTALKDARAEALARLGELFDDGESTIWYVGAGEKSDIIPGKRAYVRNAQYKERYRVLFGCTWEKRNYYPEPSGPYLSLGDGPDRCFRFYLGSDLVYWHDGNSVTTWFVGDSLPDTMMWEFSGYEADIANVTVEERNRETTEDTLRRFLDAYGVQLLSMTPENVARLADFKVLKFHEIQSKDSRILARLEMAMKPPEELLHATPWWAGNGTEGEGSLKGWIIKYQELVLELSGGVWRCTGFGTGGYSLD